MARKIETGYRANFLWPYVDGSIEEAGYEFCNGLTEEFRQQWWEILCERIKVAALAEKGASDEA